MVYCFRIDNFLLFKSTKPFLAFIPPIYSNFKKKPVSTFSFPIRSYSLSDLMVSLFCRSFFYVLNTDDECFTNSPFHSYILTLNTSYFFETSDHIDYYFKAYYTTLGINSEFFYCTFPIFHIKFTCLLT